MQTVVFSPEFLNHQQYGFVGFLSDGWCGRLDFLHGGKHTDDPANPKGNWQKTAEK